jgi:hypothetical protein
VARRTPGRLVLLAALAALAPAGCGRPMTEQQALAAAREEIRREYQPEIDRRKREIAELQRQIEEARKRLADRKTYPLPSQNTKSTP